MTSKNLSSIIAAGSGMIEPRDLANRNRLKDKIIAVMRSAGTAEVPGDMITNSRWLWSTDDTSGAVLPSYGIPVSMTELEKMVSEKVLQDLDDVEDDDSGYLKFVTNGAYVLETRNWLEVRDPGISSEEAKKEAAKKSSHFFEKIKNAKKSTADKFREAARLAREAMLALLNGSEGEIRVLRDAVAEGGQFYSLEHFTNTVVHNDSAACLNTGRNMVTTMESLRNMMAINSSRLNFTTMTRAFFTEFKKNLCKSEGTDKISGNNAIGSKKTLSEKEAETQILSRIATCCALITVDARTIEKIEDEFHKKTGKTSTPVEFFKNAKIYQEIAAAEIRRCPKRIATVKKITEESGDHDQNEELVAKIGDKSKGSKRGGGGGRGRGGGRGGRYSNGRDDSDRAKKQPKDGNEDNKDSAGSKKESTPCWHCKVAIRKWNVYDHKPYDCPYRKKALKMIRTMHKKEEQVGQVHEQRSSDSASENGGAGMWQLS
ncbi:Oidioi.mRNA.OKI2018_I69.PAR.g8584.t1.cds [Oikopleura dioica]|uniref:Oidioi.mRNA.OKI2018_I69.PAR.g8584.t1.cds n=1 Tax=Oikopleura dioica TaxID=34765 RepID=A0ABN7RKV4_OIKDI|nr:Oidioi.mRNA.OKI2018_I69.PAR.g8584.t1.cds [Oikopleura dioica]